MSLKEDTVSADRKERIIFDPDAWKKKDKSGRKTSAITSRQNFDNEKFTRNEKEQVDEGTIQASGDSKVDSASPTQGDSISDKKPKKSNNPQIEFVTGTAQPNGSSSTAIGGAQATGRKLAEAIVKKAITQVKADKNVGTEEIPFDGPYSKTPSDVVDKSGAHHTPMSRARDLARKALAKQVKKEEVEIVYEANIQPTSAKSRSHISNLSNPTVNSVTHKSKQIGLITKQSDGSFHAHHSAAKLAHAKSGTFDSKDKAHQFIRNAHADAIKKGTLSDKFTKTNEEVELDEAMYAGLEKEDKPGKKKTEMSGSKNAVAGETVEGWKDEKTPVKEGVLGAAAGAFLGLGVAGPVGALAGGYLGHKTQQAANAAKDAKKKNVKKEETDMSEKLTYTQFVEQLLEYTPGPGGVTRVQGRSYGANYDAGEDEDDKPAAPAAKRGRGRPAGSKSGANNKVTKGKSYGGIATHSLNLPNSNR